MVEKHGVTAEGNPPALAYEKPAHQNAHELTANLKRWLGSYLLRRAGSVKPTADKTGVYVGETCWRQGDGH
jgi:hypothetical protein